MKRRHMQLCAATCDQTRLHRMPNTVRNWRPPKSNPVITRSVAISAQTIVALSTAAMKQRATIVHTTSSSQCISSSSFASIYKRERERESKGGTLHIAKFVPLSLWSVPFEGFCSNGGGGVWYVGGTFWRINSSCSIHEKLSENHEKLSGNHEKLAGNHEKLFGMYLDSREIRAFDRGRCCYLSVGYLLRV